MSSKTKVKVTFYGWPDNEPPSKTIAYPKSEYPSCVHDEAGGTGTSDDPITVAVATEERGGKWKPGTKMYVPSLKKYFIVEDECANCDPDQIDVWMESNAENNSKAVDQCEKAWTLDEAEVEIEPSGDRKVDPKPFFDINNDTCNSH